LDEYDCYLRDGENQGNQKPNTLFPNGHTGAGFRYRRKLVRAGPARKEGGEAESDEGVRSKSLPAIQNLLAQPQLRPKAKRNKRINTTEINTYPKEAHGEKKSNPGDPS